MITQVPFFPDRCWPLVSTFAIGLAIASLSPTQGAVTFLFDYGIGNAGFNDPVQGENRRAALETAAATLGSWFNHDATIALDARSFTDGSDSSLAFAGTSLIVSSGFRGYLPGVVAEKIVSNGLLDANGISADGRITVNFAHSWNLGDEVDASAYDFKATVMHEMLHAVGFGSGINEDGTDLWGSETPSESTPGGGGSGGIWSPFDDFLVDVEGNAVIDDTDFHINLAHWDPNVTGGAAPANGLFFDGLHATAANKGNPVGLYTPEKFSPASSVSHLDTEYEPFEGLMMTHATSLGPGARELSGIEKGILRDLGFDIIPEPSTGALVICGGLLVWRRRRMDYP